MMAQAKGFSLFTPLVGTALVVLAVMTASMMVQNDMRTSRGISFSSIVTSDYIHAKMVKATADIGILKKMREKLEQRVISSPTFTSPPDLSKELEEYFTGPAFVSSIRNDCVLASVDALRDSLNIKELQDDTMFANVKSGISESLSGKEIISVTAGEGEYCAEVILSNFEDENVKQAMSVTTEDPEHNSEQKISFAPSTKLKTCINVDVDKIDEEAGSIWEAVNKDSAKGASCSLVSRVSVTTYSNQVTGDEQGKRVEVKFDHKYGTFKATVEEGSTSGSETKTVYYCENGKLSSKGMILPPPAHLPTPATAGEEPSIHGHKSMQLP